MIAKFLVALLVAYLGWRLWHGFGRARPASPAGLTETPEVASARALLGVAPRADAAAIRAAHRRLVAAEHPDRGGSEDVTSRLNAARDLLLGADSSRAG